jgi:hypothetical protein
MSLETTLSSWATAPGQTEQTKCDNAVRAVRKAIEASAALENRTISVSPQGSYHNRTNVRLDSDVDICVLCSDVCFVDYSLSEGLGDADVGLVDHPYTYAEFKDDVEEALSSYFGSSAVVRGNKAFDIHENTYRIDADAVACFEHRRYQRYSTGGFYHYSGTQLLPDKGGKIVNWPEQNYDNGVAKNKETGQRFKDVVRIIKRLRNKMADEKIAAAEQVPSFLIECLVWNVPSGGFGHDTYTADLRWALVHIFNNTMNFDDCKEWGEVNELKYLFRLSQTWTMEQAHQFASAAWNYLEFK